MEDKENAQDKPSVIPPNIAKQNSRESLKDTPKVRISYLICWIIRRTDRGHAMSSPPMSSPPMGSRVIATLFRSPSLHRNGHSRAGSEFRS